MKRIVICCDGTWNRSDQKFATNVVKLRNAVRPTSSTGVKQLTYYINGVGTKSLVDKLPGGVFGAGLWQNVQLAYRHLVEHYEPDDEVYLFGFSRGAYTARSVAGMVRKCGVLKSNELSHIEEAYEFYRDDAVKPGAQGAIDFRQLHSLPLGDAEPGFENVPGIKFVGVWDTVGALGIPLGILGKVFNRKHRFHDVSLSRIVEYGYHALAIDERRKPFRPTLWERHPQATKQVLGQRWFAGVHTSVGGGNADARQSDRALLWMMSKARQVGLEFDPAAISGVSDSLEGAIPESLFQKLASKVPFNLLTYLRPIGAGVPYREATYLGGLSEESLDPGVIDRNVKDASYMPPNLVAYLRDRPDVLATMQTASRSVWP